MSSALSTNSASISSCAQEDLFLIGENSSDKISIDTISSVSTATEGYEEVSYSGQLVENDLEMLFPSSSSSHTSTSSSETNGVAHHNEKPKNQTYIKTAPISVTEAPDWPTGLSRNTHLDVDRTLLRRLLHIGPIFAIVIVLIIGMTASVLHVTWWPITTPLGCADLLIFLTWNYLVLFNLLKAAFVGGGYVSIGWHPTDEAHQKRLQYCHKCNGFKAPRSHHCAKCNRCVMKMDHHCPWINNCVGHRNQVYFIRFLFFAVVGCTHGAVILTCCIWNTLSIIYWSDPYKQPLHKHKFIIDSIYSFMAAVLAVSFAMGVIIAVGFLLFIQLKSAWRNRTGIEQYICLKAEYRYREDTDDEFAYPYDLGWRRNLREVFNENLAFAKGNGIWWPVVAGCDQFTLTEEQLEQKRLKQEYARAHPHSQVSNSYWARFSRRCIQPIYKKFM
uniref:Palmitoyltransferase n=1 Tax=Ditylenchus dipsaci TaxID=166011 RepID=A0A915E8M2_9BILA